MMVGTAGHNGHGTTALMQRLTGIDIDRLKEEKARGISIELGLAYWPRPNGDSIGFVEVPGHEGLVHNMLAGASGIDFAILVVAADDGGVPLPVGRPDFKSGWGRQTVSGGFNSHPPPPPSSENQQ